MKCKKCDNESLGLGWPKPDLCDKCHPKWVCSNCGNTEYREREIICWKCGKGDMNHVRTTEAHAMRQNNHSTQTR